MASATFTKVQQFVEDLGNGVHNLDSDTLKWVLTNTAPTAAGTKVLSDITEITAEHGYDAGGPTMSNNAYSQTSGTAKLTGDDTTITASGGSIGPFRYAALYNATSASKAVIGYLDYGSSITVTDGDSFVLDLGTDGAVEIA